MRDSLSHIDCFVGIRMTVVLCLILLGVRQRQTWRWSAFMVSRACFQCILQLQSKAMVNLLSSEESTVKFVDDLKLSLRTWLYIDVYEFVFSQPHTWDKHGWTESASTKCYKIINELANTIVLIYNTSNMKIVKTTRSHEDFCRQCRLTDVHFYKDRFSGEVDRQVVGLLTEYCGFEVRSFGRFIPRKVGMLDFCWRLRMVIWSKCKFYE